MTFPSLGLHPALVRNLESRKFTAPTEIQAGAIPPALEGRDVLGAAATGSGNFPLEKTGKVWDDSSNKAHWKNRQPGQPFFAVFNFEITHESQIRKRPHTAPKSARENGNFP